MKALLSKLSSTELETITTLSVVTTLSCLFFSFLLYWSVSRELKQLRETLERTRRAQRSYGSLNNNHAPVCNQDL